MSVINLLVFRWAQLIYWISTKIKGFYFHQKIKCCGRNRIDFHNFCIEKIAEIHFRWKCVNWDHRIWRFLANRWMVNRRPGSTFWKRTRRKWSLVNGFTIRWSKCFGWESREGIVHYRHFCLSFFFSSVLDHMTWNWWCRCRMIRRNGTLARLFECLSNFLKSIWIMWCGNLVQVRLRDNKLMIRLK